MFCSCGVTFDLKLGNSVVINPNIDQINKIFKYGDGVLKQSRKMGHIVGTKGFIFQNIDEFLTFLITLVHEIAHLNYVKFQLPFLLKLADVLVAFLVNENIVATSKTNKKGVAVFKKLEPRAYFVDARTEDKNNDGEGVEVQPLLEGRINKVNIVIE